MSYATYPQDNLGITNPEDWAVEILSRVPDEGNTEWLTFTCNYQGGESITVESVPFEEGSQNENIKMWLANMDDVLLPKPPGMSKTAFTVQYAWNLLCLWVKQKISWQTLCWAYRARPIAVCGRGGSYHVDPFDPNTPMHADAKP